MQADLVNKYEQVQSPPPRTHPLPVDIKDDILVVSPNFFFLKNLCSEGISQEETRCPPI
jgi:hypothetical protein